MRAFELTLTTVIALIIGLVTMVAILIFFKGGFEIGGGSIAGVVKEAANETGGDLIPNKMSSSPKVFFGFCDCETAGTGDPDCTAIDYTKTTCDGCHCS
ncbi:MAG: hypothetical protein ABH829_03945 [archaeon]